MNGEADARRTLDVAALPPMAFGNQGLIWWGTVGFMVIEGSMFVIGLVVYFYLRLQVRDWPPGLPNPGLGSGRGTCSSCSRAACQTCSRRRPPRSSILPASASG